MGSLLKFGCLGVVALAVLIGVLVAVGLNQLKPQQAVTGQPAPDKAGGATPALAQVGQTVSLGGWELTLLDFGPYDRFSPGKPPVPQAQGKLVVADMRIKNLQNSTSNFTQGDFALKAGDGREFKAAAQTASIEKGFVVSQTVQPGLTTENRVVFDIDPAATDLTFTALRMQFQVPNP